MISTSQLILIADAYKAAACVERDQTVSYRVFGDSKKLAALRKGAGITLDRYNASIEWFRDNWPKGHAVPNVLRSGDHHSPHGPASSPIQGQASVNATKSRKRRAS